jgi:hypothetical protein
VERGLELGGIPSRSWKEAFNEELYSILKATRKFPGSNVHNTNFNILGVLNQLYWNVKMVVVVLAKPWQEPS